MSAGSKSGLLFMVPQMIAVVIATLLGFIPLIFLGGSPVAIIGCCAAPFASLIIAVVAGFFAAYWHDGNGARHQSLMAGLISGAGALLGVTLFWVIIGVLISNTVDAATMNEALRQMERMQPGAQLDRGMLTSMMGIISFVMAGVGVLLGLISLAFAVLGGLLGAMLANRDESPSPPAVTTTPLT
jgi:MFS family permease